MTVDVLVQMHEHLIDGVDRNHHLALVCVQVLINLQITHECCCYSWPNIPSPEAGRERERDDDLNEPREFPSNK